MKLCENAAFIIEDAKKRRERMISSGKKFKRRAIPKKIKLVVFKRDKGFCVQCKQIITGRPEYHHIIPLVYGGTNTEDNICLICNSCHIAIHSGDETPEKYYSMLKLYLCEGVLYG